MRTYLPFILVGLAIFSAICVAFVAREVTRQASGDGKTSEDRADDQR
tara:strand:- start:19381 stop:19521 length:141 start_codon:yes stop_codon:yes gene_type:complete